jgi:hypothetical protein
MMKLRLELGGSWEHAVESHIGEGFHKATGIPTWTCKLLAGFIDRFTQRDTRY